MDACAHYYLEKESGLFLHNITNLDNLESLVYYKNRYVHIEGEEVWCVECGALDTHAIYLSDDCPETQAECFIDPCLNTSCLNYPNAEC